MPIAVAHDAPLAPSQPLERSLSRAERGGAKWDTYEPAAAQRRTLSTTAALAQALRPGPRVQCLTLATSLCALALSVGNLDSRDPESALAQGSAIVGTLAGVVALTAAALASVEAVDASASAIWSRFSRG